MGRQLTLPSNRLCAAANNAAAPLFEGETDKLYAIDVGCDHAKLAIYLIQSGICSRVTACDINDGPVQKAKENISRRTLKGKPLSDYIDVVCTDGLSGLENLNANRIFILGMGGELIADILEKADFIKNDYNKGKIKFILQPMTSEDRLRVYLYTHGFDIIDEELCFDKGRIYTIMSVVYDGILRSEPQYVCMLGKHNIQKGTELFYKRLCRTVKIVERALNERLENGLESNELEELLSKLKAIKSDSEKQGCENIETGENQ